MLSGIPSNFIAIFENTRRPKHKKLKPGEIQNEPKLLKLTPVGLGNTPEFDIFPTYAVFFVMRSSTTINRTLPYVYII